ncbi:Hsp90 co-chaperone Cdc37 [Pseudocercospora fuligena]|uniref:Hsp90 chaperone protein kinase-targeting subunit n=1 Tax=Pseudocercospora fuligena TaxID=685502 RepID=A0A8H6RT13_9PEZI|nr:Hsp90 co-chaperone Cdc37 [Pseudocercospora fuligena]
MPVDYSKWDALELSDDSDIEVHPNVDKKSFIRAKQNQIHQQRIDRKHRITTLKYERIINDGLLIRIDALLRALDNHKADIEGAKDADSVDEVVFDCLTDVAGDVSLGEDQPPAPPAGVHKNMEQPSYSKMMGALVDQVKSEVEKTGAEGPPRYTAYIREVQSHNQKVQNLQKDLDTELTKLEKEEGSKITSETYKTGFDSSHVSKAKAKSVDTSSAAVTKTGKSSEAQLLNASNVEQIGGPRDSGSAADVEDLSLNPAPGEDEDDMECSSLARKFGKLGYGSYKQSLDFIGQNPQILSEKETDGLLVEAFNAQTKATNAETKAEKKKEEDYARGCVHQALLLQYCRQLGKDGVGLFFQRVQTANHQAQKLFLDDVNNTYARIRDRTAELAKQAAEEGTGDKEQIQLHAVDPNTTINILTPPPLDQCQTDDERASRRIFESFPPGLQRALESGSLDKVNEVLGKMSVEEAEEVVEQLGNGGMLSLEQGVIDATTDEGRKQIEEIERTHKMPGQQGDGRVEELGEVEEMD